MSRFDDTSVLEAALTVQLLAASITTQYQPRFVAYCRAHGRSPEAQLAHDLADYPVARMLPSMAWIQARIVEWAAAVGCRGFESAIQIHGQDAFTAWLETWGEK